MILRIIQVCSAFFAIIAIVGLVVLFYETVDHDGISNSDVGIGMGMIGAVCILMVVWIEIYFNTENQ